MTEAGDGGTGQLHDPGSGYPLLRAGDTRSCVLSVSPGVCGLEIIPNSRLSRKARQRLLCPEASALTHEDGCKVGWTLATHVRPPAMLSLRQEESPCWTLALPM